MENEELLSKGLLEKIGIKGSNLQHRKGSKKHVIEREIKLLFSQLISRIEKGYLV